MNKMKSAFCNICGSQRMVQKERANHILHIILVFCTGGLWFPVWVIQSWKGCWRCSFCGSNKVKGVH